MNYSIIFTKISFSPEVCLKQFETPPTGFWQNFENCQFLEKNSILGTTKQNS